MKTLSLPQGLETWIESQLKELSSSLTHAPSLAQAIKQMADFYIENPQTSTPWSEGWCQKAQLAYYFPLNFLRNLRVFQELQSLNFFQDPFHWYEIGAGLGPSLESYLHTLPSSSLNKLLGVNLIETAQPAKNITQQRWQNNTDIKPQWFTSIPKVLPPHSLLVMSYSFTEFEKIPEWIWSADSIIIIEPSTREDGRRLLQLRAEALQKGFQAIAPCTHNKACPLLTHSQKDWCHDRFGFDRPAWMLEIEKYLPFKNQTLTLSYLALKRQAPLSTATQRTRVVGDFLDEKGKTRQLICRGSEREFLSFIKKSTEPVELFRGDLLTLPDSIEKKGDELRPSPQDLFLFSSKSPPQ